MATEEKIELLSKVIDGVLSGVWKYSCYKYDNLLNEIEKKMLIATGNKDNIFISDKYFNNISNSKIINVNYLDQLGEFLFDVAIFYKYACKFYKKTPHSDYNNMVYQYPLYNGYYSSKTNEKYRKIFESNDSIMIEKYINKNLNDFVIKSFLLMDEYSLYDENSTFNNYPFKKCLAILSSDDMFKQTFMRVPHFVFNNALIVPVSDENEATMLEKVFDIIEQDSVRVLYFNSKNENIKLLYNNSFKGKIFTRQLKHALDSYESLQIPCTVPELILLSDEKIVDSKSSKYDFHHVESYKKNNNIFRIYHIKKGVKEMHIGNQEVDQGTIINIENIYMNGDNDVLLRELNEAKEKCNDQETEKKISEAIENLKKGDNKFINSLKWLGENAFDLIKSVGSGLLVEFINKICMNY